MLVFYQKQFNAVHSQIFLRVSSSFMQKLNLKNKREEEQRNFLKKQKLFSFSLFSHFIQITLDCLTLWNHFESFVINLLHKFSFEFLHACLMSFFFSPSVVNLQDVNSRVDAHLMKFTYRVSWKAWWNQPLFFVHTLLLDHK